MNAQVAEMLFKRLVSLCLAVALTSGTMLAQTAGSAGPRVRVTSAGERISGRLIAVDATDVTIQADGNPDPIRIPLSSVAIAEVSRGKRSRALAWLLGVAVGVVAGVGTAFLIGRGSQGRGICEACLEMLVVGPTVGVASGLVTVYAVRSERWRSVPLPSLASLLAPVTP